MRNCLILNILAPKFFLTPRNSLTITHIHLNFFSVDGQLVTIFSKFSPKLFRSQLLGLKRFASFLLNILKNDVFFACFFRIMKIIFRWC